jgi:hypothetical protein
MNDEAKNLGRRVLFGDMTKEETRVLGKAIAIYGYRVATVVVILWMFGMFDRFRLGGGFAFAEDVKINTQTVVAAAVEPLTQRLDAFEKAMSKQALETKQLRDLVVSEKLANLESKLIESKIRQCKADTDTARSYFRERVSEFKKQIQDLTPDRQLHEPSCAEL